MLRARSESSKKNRKKFILACAEQLIMDEGLANLSIAKVSKKTDLAVGTIYLYFSNKEDIIAHLTLKSRKVLLQRFEAYSREKENALDKITQVLWAFYSFYKDKPFYSQLVSFYESNSGLQETEELRQASQSITSFVAGIVALGKKQQCMRMAIHETQFSFWLWGTTVGVIQLLEVKQSLLTESLHQSEKTFYSNHIAMVIQALKKE